MSTSGADRLRQHLAQADVDFRSGGFLGVACRDNPCRVTQVQPNSAAERAGVRIDDVIVRYNDQPVQTMDDLTRQISQHGVGQKVTIEVLRNDQRLIHEIELGKWE
jgi:S1-C subfamily serine protease